MVLVVISTLVELPLAATRAVSPKARVAAEYFMLADYAVGLTDGAVEGYSKIKGIVSDYMLERERLWNVRLTKDWYE